MPLPEVEMTVFETILARRSVRSYRTQRVEQPIIGSMLEAAVHAPTAISQDEPCGFIIIQDKQLLQSLSDQAKSLLLAQTDQYNLKYTDLPLSAFDNPDFNIFYDADTLILICGRTAAPFYIADCWLAAENLILAACAMGLGTCVASNALPVFDIPEVRVRLRILDGFSAVAPIVLGYPSEDMAPVLRKKPAILANIQASEISH